MDDIDVVQRFLTQAREIALGERDVFDIDPGDLSQIASDPAMRIRFERLLDLQNDAGLRRLIVRFLYDRAAGYDDEARGEDRKVDLFDRAGMAIAGSVAATGVGTTVAVIAGGAKGAAAGSLLGPIGALAGGLIGIAVVSLGRHTLKKRADRSRSMADRLRRLVGKD